MESGKWIRKLGATLDPCVEAKTTTKAHTTKQNVDPTPDPLETETGSTIWRICFGMFHATAHGDFSQTLDGTSLVFDLLAFMGATDSTRLKLGCHRSSPRAEQSNAFPRSCVLFSMAMGTDGLGGGAVFI